jgi:SH3 domain protein
MLLLIVIGLSGIGQSAWAGQAYVTDSFKITLRSGPDTKNKIIAMLPSGALLDVLDFQDKWSHVLVPRENQKNLEGWVLSRYLISRVPWKQQAEHLKNENSRLKEKLARVEEERSEMASRSQEFSKKLKNNAEILNNLQDEYASLKKGSSHYLELKERYEEAQSSLKIAQSTIQKLTSENEKLISSEKHTWFIIGASVLLCGFVIGLLIGRKQKKQKSMFYSDL